MAKKESNMGFIGTRISAKQYKIFLATAKTPEERAAIKSLYLSPPLKFYSKNEEPEELKTDLIK